MNAVSTLSGQAAWAPHPKQASAMMCPATELLFGGAKGGGKPLACDTPVPTPTGWTTQGELRAGDRVIGADGTIANVLGTTGPMFQRRCYRLYFSDGTSLVADSEHPWTTYTHADRVALKRRSDEFRAARRAKRASKSTGKKPWLAERNAARALTAATLPPPEPSVRTTEEILASLYVGKKSKVCNHSIEAMQPAQFPHAKLPVPPYTLGAWLGDGSSAAGDITCDDVEILDRIRRDGFEVSNRAQKLSHGVLGLKVKLRDAGVLGAKRIPTEYLRASVLQRIELLRGLMDTDGWCERDGTCFFVSADKSLFDGVVELIRSLGIVSRVSSRLHTCTNSKTRNKTLAWRVRFVTNIPAFHLPRKLARQNLHPHERWTRRFITKIEPVDSVAVCCIKTDRADGLYAAGEQWILTHNSHFLAACWLPLLQLAHAKFLRTGMLQKKCRIAIFRKNLNDLEDFIGKTFEIYPLFDPQMGVAGYHKNQKVWTFTSGATVECHHLDGPDDHKGFNGNEFVGLGFDEVQQISYPAYSFLVAQLRSGDPEYHAARMVRCTANPGGEDWLIPHFHIDECPNGGRIFREAVELDGEKHEMTRAFIRSFLRDNPSLPRNYEGQLRLTMSEDEVAMYLDGDFFRVAGSFFSKFLRPRVHFVKSRPVPASWNFRFGIDWGSTNPAAFLMGAQDNDGRLYIIDELVQPGVTGKHFGENLNDHWKRQKWCPDRKFANGDIWGVIDKQAADNYGAEDTAADGIADWGFRLFPADKRRRNGINQMKERLLMDRHGNPQVVIFEDRCPNLVRALSAIPSNAPKDPEDYDPRSPFAHVCDAFRFICQEFPLIARREENPIDAEVARWDALIRKQRESRNDNSGAMGTGYGD